MKENNWQFVSLDLARKMAELGFKQDSMFYWCRIDGIDYPQLVWSLDRSIPDLACERICSAYSVAELGEMLPVGFTYYRRHMSNEWEIFNWCFKGVLIPEMRSNTEVDARSKMLIYLAQNKLIEVNK